MVYILIILVFLILAPYIIYPVIMLLLSYLLPQKFPGSTGDLPYVTIIIPTYNEEKVIAERVKNLEALQYPREKLQVIIIDSGSNDRTYQIAQESFWILK